MQVTIDQAGRFGLHKNKPIEQESALIRDKHGWLVHTGRPVGKIDWDRLVQEDREEQIRKTGGW